METDRQFIYPSGNISLLESAVGGRRVYQSAANGQNQTWVRSVKPCAERIGRRLRIGNDLSIDDVR